MNSLKKFHAFARKGNLKGLTSFIASKPLLIDSRDENGFTALHLAIINKQLKSITYLIHSGANTKLRTDKGLLPVELAIYIKRLPVFKVLFKQSSSTERFMLLHLSVALDASLITKFLINAGFDIDKKDEKGRSPIHWAAQEGAISSVKILIENHAKIDVLDKEQFSPLSIAAAEGHLNVVRLLLKNKVKVNQKVEGGGTALHLAYAWGNLKIVNLLLKNGGNNKIKNNDGRYPIDLLE